MYPLSKQPNFVSNIERMKAVSPEVASSFAALRKAIDGAGDLTERERQLCLLAGFAATRNEGGFRVHCTRAKEAGLTLSDVHQLVLLMLGTSLGLAPVIETIDWASDELG